MHRFFQELKRRVVGITHFFRRQKLRDVLRRLLEALRKEKTSTSTVRDAFSRMSEAAKAPLPPSDIVVMPSRDTEASPLKAARGKAPQPVSDDHGKFVSGVFTHATETRRYMLFDPMLFTPTHRDARRMPLVVMLHGCKQDAEDFATGTGMNILAREQGLHVLYPEQSHGANPYRCWNWFNQNHQHRDHGEPALIAAMTRAMIEQHDVDAERVYIAGLSAGAAMAVIVAATYPEIFSAVGVHSGLARGAAGNALEAMTVMKNGMRADSLPRDQSSVGFTSAVAAAHARIAVPTIVFHGDADTTVHPRNGEQVLAAALAAIDDKASNDEPGATEARQARVDQGESASGQRYTRAVHHDAAGKVIAEHWVLHGAGHAWAGGHADGSFTDAKGPDASREMLRFFLQQRRRGAS